MALLRRSPLIGPPGLCDRLYDDEVSFVVRGVELCCGTGGGVLRGAKTGLAPDIRPS